MISSDLCLFPVVSIVEVFACGETFGQRDCALEVSRDSDYSLVSHMFWLPWPCYYPSSVITQEKEAVMSRAPVMGKQNIGNIP